MTDNSAYVDKYFTKTLNCVDDTRRATYGVFLRHDSICAIDRAIAFLLERAPSAIVTRHYAERALVPAETPLFSYDALIKDVVELETELLQFVGISCICAYNAYKMCVVCPDISFLDMHARHAAGRDMVLAAAYGASVGSKAAQMQGAKGFIGSSLDATAHFYDTKAGLGTMPHVLIGYAGSTLKAVQLFVEKNPNDQLITALVDYYGKEITDSLEVAEWFAHAQKTLVGMGNKTLGVRLDTHGGRFLEGIDYDSSVEIVGDLMRKKGKWPIVKAVMGDDAFDISSDAVRDNVAKILFGTGVSAAAIIHTRQSLDRAGHKDVKIVASSGFGLRKCRIMAKVPAPIDMIGTGSFLPETISETFATADCFAYDGVFSCKVGREAVFAGVFKR